MRFDPNEIRMWPVWIEGYAASGGCSAAQFLGEFEGTWEEACRSSVKDKSYDFCPNLFGENRHAYWGCEFFDNETDARRSFG